MKTVTQLREERDLWRERFQPNSGVQAAVKFRGKVYTSDKNATSIDAVTHDAVVQKMIHKLKVSADDLDRELTADSFGYVVDGKFVNDNGQERSVTQSDMGRSMTRRKGVYFSTRPDLFKPQRAKK